MLKLIDEDIQFYQRDFLQYQQDEETFLSDSIVISLYFAYLSQFSFDQREQFLTDWQKNLFAPILPVRSQWNLLEFLLNEKGASQNPFEAQIILLRRSRIERLPFETRIDFLIGQELHSQCHHSRQSTGEKPTCSS